MKQGRWAIATVSVILGFMIAIQYKSNLEVEKSSVSLQRAGELAIQLAEVKQEKEKLEEQLNIIKEQGTLDGIRQENEKLRFQAGLVAVKGPGISVIIDDSKLPVKVGENANLYLIHDEDLLKIINELRAAGAEVIAINGQRLRGTSEIRCSGPTVTVNGQLFTPPYVIEAIGDSKRLAAALNMRGGVMESLSYWGIQLRIEEKKEIHIPAFDGPFREQFVKPEGGDAQ